MSYLECPRCGCYMKKEPRCQEPNCPCHAEELQAAPAPVTPQELRKMANAIDPTKDPPPYGYMSGVPNTLRQLADWLEKRPTVTREQIIKIIADDEVADAIMALLEAR